MKGAGRVRVLVVDDSAFMRRAISTVLESDPEIEVVGTAGDGLEALEKVKSLDPDLVTLDIEMPRMDGLTVLKHIMKEHPLPVLMVSSLTTEGADATLTALELGAVDFIPKDLSISLDIVRIRHTLLEKVKAIAKRGLRRRAPTEPKILTPPPKRKFEVVAIGVSTGGPMSLQKVLTKLPADLPAGVLVVQHMPPKFTKSLAERLDRLSTFEVREAVDGDEVTPGRVLLAPGGRHLRVRRKGEVEVGEEPFDALYKPSVDELMASVAEHYGPWGIGIIMTGMGHDGRNGIRLLKRKGGYIIAQDEASCVVYGMPRAIVEEGLADAILPLDEIPGHIYRLLSPRSGGYTC
ncbi:MAG: chemotaxis response regulator protein-glutamate methylesterase [Candidatus Latescibacterota bacterium]|nr:MAG: chemotaxis response regulator protein-glutamate methylesterase [Candidatus Latescibacterota bacterium]RKY73687.1 MAG: chemotaxis response regulator protein-glutamate methylesterase [Candidatus Latescibacterota bacterium]HDH99898.1 chemotaxis response regulator protein-glutamate methylesterase [Bacillota bacterium]